MQHKKGDLVRLKSGGPVMTVQFIRDGYELVAECTWFVGDNTKTGSFSGDSLEKIEPGELKAKFKPTSAASIMY